MPCPYGDRPRPSASPRPILDKVGAGFTGDLRLRRGWPWRAWVAEGIRPLPRHEHPPYQRRRPPQGGGIPCLHPDNAQPTRPAQFVAARRPGL